MEAIPSRLAVRWRAVARAMAILAPVLCAWAGLAGATAGSKILFPRDTAVPRMVQEFAWRVVETHCNYQSFEREQRSFWAYRARAQRGEDGVTYSISVIADLAWRKTEPPGLIDMTIVDDGGLRLKALTSSFVVCALDPR